MKTRLFLRNAGLAIAFATLGAYTLNNNVVDLVVLWVIGLIGFVLDTMMSAVERNVATKAGRTPAEAPVSVSVAPI